MQNEKINLPDKLDDMQVIISFTKLGRIFCIKNITQGSKLINARFLKANIIFLLLIIYLRLSQWMDETDEGSL